MMMLQTLLPSTTADLLSWMVQSTLCLGVCWLLYHYGLRQERFFHYNRRFLQFTPWLALLLPRLLAVAGPWLAGWLPATASTLLSGGLLPALTVRATATADLATALPPWLPLVYFGGVLLLLARLGCQVLWLWYSARHFPREIRAGYVLVHTQGQRPISSFGRWIFWDDTALLSPSETRAVLAHELAHVWQGHTAERLQLELVRALLWFNPVMHLYPRALTQVHEFLADAAALQVTSGPATPDTSTPYTALLARLALRGFQPQLPLTHSFTQSFTLTRIRMLTSFSPVRRWKQWLLLPVAAILLGLLGAAQVAAQTLPAPPPAPPAPNTLVYQYVDQMPVYPGGQDQFMQDLAAGIAYPKAAKEAGVNTKVFIGFVIGADGRIYDILLKKGAQAPDPALAAALDAAALQAVKALTKPWQPGRQDGKPVAVSYTLPITFAP